MITKVLSHTPTKLLIAVCIIVVSAICIYTPNYYIFKLGARFAGLIMVGYLLIGLVFLFIGQNGLMLTSFICCAGICLFLKNASYADLIHARPSDNTRISLAHFNISSISDPEEALARMLDANPDVISIQEITPDWNYLLNEALGEKYPYQQSIVRFDPYGLAVYSKYELTDIDTFSIADVPNLTGNIRLEDSEEELRFIAAHTSAPLYNTAYSLMKDQVKRIADQTNASELPSLVVGNFNAPPWWGEIQGLRKMANLMDSRRSTTIGFSEIFNSPENYIFYTPKLKCLGFQNLFLSDNSQVGIMGSYELNIDEE